MRALPQSVAGFTEAGRPGPQRGGHRAARATRPPCRWRAVTHHTLWAVSALAWPACGIFYHTGHVTLDNGSAVVGLLCTLALGVMRWRDEHAPAQTAVSADEGAEYPYSLVAQVRANTADVAEIAGRVDALNRALGAALEYAEIQGPVSRPSRWRHLRPLRDATGPQPRVLCTASACGLSA